MIPVDLMFSALVLFCSSPCPDGIAWNTVTQECQCPNNADQQDDMCHYWTDQRADRDY